MPKKSAPDGALFVRLPASAVDKLDRAAEVLRMRKKDLVANLVSRYVDPASQRGLDALGPIAAPRGVGEVHEVGFARGSYSFQPNEPMPLPEVLNAEQAAQLLQIDEVVVLELAEAGKLPGRKLGAAWRFSRAALVEWLAKPETR
jgi:excisionase family DNA binding protein